MKRGSDAMKMRRIVLAVLLGGAACGRPSSDESEARRRAWRGKRAVEQPPPAHRFQSVTHLANAHLGVTTTRRGLDGKPARVRCRVCHDTVQPKKENEMAKRLKGFHAGVELAHGDQTCRTCHNPPRFDDFRLGSGKTVAYAEVIELCGQCHARQRADYGKGIHGGMSGYWDLDRGPRDRNACVDCHNPHRPRIGPVTPAPRPRYRRPAAAPPRPAHAAHGAAR